MPIENIPTQAWNAETNSNNQVGIGDQHGGEDLKGTRRWPDAAKGRHLVYISPSSNMIGHDVYDEYRTPYRHHTHLPHIHFAGGLLRSFFDLFSLSLARSSSDGVLFHLDSNLLARFRKRISNWSQLAEICS